MLTRRLANVCCNQKKPFLGGLSFASFTPLFFSLSLSTLYPNLSTTRFCSHLFHDAYLSSVISSQVSLSLFEMFDNFFSTTQMAADVHTAWNSHDDDSTVVVNVHGRHSNSRAKSMSVVVKSREKMKACHNHNVCTLFVRPIRWGIMAACRRNNFIILHTFFSIVVLHNK